MPIRSHMTTLREHWRLLVLIFILLNWLWSLSGGWWIEIGAVHIRRGETDHTWKGLYSARGRIVFANSITGGMRYGLRPRNPIPPTTLGVTTFNAGVEHPRSYSSSLSYKLSAVSSGRGLHGIGFQWTDYPLGTPFARRWVSIPWWFLFAIFAVEPVRRIISPILAARRYRRTGLCPSCGYDLRASPDRCPECGLVVDSTDQARPVGRVGSREDHRESSAVSSFDEAGHRDDRR